MDITNVKACFTIIADKLDHNTISSLLEISPDYIRHNNEKLKNGRLFGHDEWGIETEYEPSLDVLEQLNKIIGLLVNKNKVINNLCKNYKAKCSFLVAVNVENGEFPAMGLDVDFIKFAASINAEIGFDPYFLSDADDFE